MRYQNGSYERFLSSRVVRGQLCEQHFQGGAERSIQRTQSDAELTFRERQDRKNEVWCNFIGCDELRDY